MLTEAQHERVNATARTLQIIVVALMSGLVTFTVVVVVMRFGKPPEDVKLTFLTYAGLAFAVIGAIAAKIVPGMMTTGLESQITAGHRPSAGTPYESSPELGDVTALCQFFQTRTIVAAAILEGPGFLNAIAYLKEGRLMSLPVIAAMLLGMIMLLPMRDRLAEWVEQQLRATSEFQHLDSEN